MLKRIVVLCAIAALLPAAALAQTERTATARKASHRSSRSAGPGPMVTAWGPRLGFSSSPDQFVIGGQLDFRQVAPDLHISPNVEFGFGDDFTWVALNGDLRYNFDVRGSTWSPYMGGGLSVNFWSWHAPLGLPDDSGTEMGANLIFGAAVPLQSGSRFFTEARIGLGDIPDLKVMAGWNFRM
jgi:ribosomal protein L27